MNVWQFRKLVRENRNRLKFACPAGAALQGALNPGKYTARVALDLPEPYVQGMMNGFDQRAENTTCYVDITADSTAADQYLYRDGYLYGSRIARVALALRSEQ